jgi:type VI secretion system protein ImpM
VPEILTSVAYARILRHAAIGFHGKIPARGDFVQSGLPRTFTDPWDGWMQRMVAASRSALGEAWLPAWLEAPVWRFALSSGICGPDAVIGLWMPSVDSVGRYSPLTLAAVAHGADRSGVMCDTASFFAAAERVGRDALANELDPEEIAVRLAVAAALPESPAGPGSPAGPDPYPYPAQGALWWTEGGPRVSPQMLASAGLPDENTFAVMLDACASISPVIHSKPAG